MTPKLSVVVPTRDTRELTLRCLASVHAGLPPAVEVLLVDDGSSDDTAPAVRARWPSVRVVALPTSRGFTVAANRGLSEARGEILLLLNSDTEVAADALGRLLAAFDRRPRLGAAGARLRFADGRPQWSAGAAPGVLWLVALASGAATALARVPGYRTVRPLPAARRSRVDWVTGAALAIRRSAWHAAGPLDERFRLYCQDLDVCLRILDAGWEVAVLPDVHVTHHGGATISRDPGAVAGGYHPEALWTDLVRWAAKRHGAAGARRTARSLRLGGTLRVGARSLAVPFLRGRRRERWRRDTLAFRRALGAVTAAARVGAL